MARTKIKGTEFRHQTTRDTGMIAIYSTVSKAEIVRAIRSFWLPFADERQGEFNLDTLQATVLESAKALEAQALLIRRRFGLEAADLEIETEIDSEDEQPARASLLFDDDEELD